MRTLVNVPPPSLDSTTEHYISTIAHCGSLSRQCKATERSENATSLRSAAQPINDYHASPTESIPNADTSAHSGPAVVVLYMFNILTIVVPCRLAIEKMKQNILNLSVVFHL